MNTFLIPAALLDAANSPDWRAMPEGIAQYRSDGGSTAGAAFWDTIARACGCPTHALRQRCAAFDLVRRNARELGDTGLVAAWSRPYTHLELIARIDQVDHALAIRLLKSPTTGNSVKALRRQLDEARKTTGSGSGLVLGHRALGDAKNLVAVHIESCGPHGIYGGPLQFVGWKGDAEFVSPSMAAGRKIGRTSYTEAILVTTKGDLAGIYKAIAKAAFESTFFGRYWIAVPDSNPYHRFVPEKLQRLGLQNVGLVTFDLAAAKVEIRVDAGRPGWGGGREHLLHLPKGYFT